MPGVRDVLYRFRPAGAPGAPSAAGVPIDRAADLDAELAPLFADLAEVERECAGIRDKARHDADQLRADAAEQARAIVASAAAHTEAERTAALASGRSDSAQAAGEQLVAARRQASAIQSRAGQAVPGYVSRVAESVGVLLAGAGTP